MQLTPPQSSLPPKFYGTLLACRRPSRPPPGPAGNNINSSLAPPGKKQSKIDSSGHRTRAPTRFRNGRVPLDQPRLLTKYYLRLVTRLLYAISGMFKNMSLLKTRDPGELPSIECTLHLSAWFAIDKASLTNSLACLVPLGCPSLFEWYDQSYV